MVANNPFDIDAPGDAKRRRMERLGVLSELSSGEVHDGDYSYNFEIHGHDGVSVEARG